MSSIRELPQDQVVQLVDGIITRAIERRASDVHFEPDESAMRVRFRIDGLLHDVDRLPAGLAENVVARLKVMASLLTYRPDVPQEGAFRHGGEQGEGTSSRAAAVSPPPRPSERGGAPEHLPRHPHREMGTVPFFSPPIEVRVASFPTVRGERVAVRLLYQIGQVSALDELGLSEQMVAQLRAAAQRPQGLILVTGPSGSGKSTTLYALARHILTVQPFRSVVSLEDPVEQRVEGMAQIQISPHGELDYAKAMRSLLRQDVEVLLVGEIRDAQTAHIVIEAALTGHLIMSTLHSGDPAEAITRLLEMGIAPYQVVSALTVCCSQRLLRTICPTCHESRRESRNGEGNAGPCRACGGAGYAGRIACGQIASMSERLRQAVLAHAPLTELRRIVGANETDLVADARRLIEGGKTTTQEMQRALGC